MQLTRTVTFRRGTKGRREIREDEPPKPVGRVPRVSKLMALAIRFERLVRDGVVADYAEIARLGHVTRGRMSQIMALLNLAPDIQEAVLRLPLVESGKDPITERDLRPIAAELDWETQRKNWNTIGSPVWTGGP